MTKNTHFLKVIDCSAAVLKFRTITAFYPATSDNAKKLMSKYGINDAWIVSPTLKMQRVTLSS